MLSWSNVFNDLYIKMKKNSTVPIQHILLLLRIDQKQKKKCRYSAYVTKIKMTYYSIIKNDKPMKK